MQGHVVICDDMCFSGYNRGIVGKNLCLDFILDFLDTQILISAILDKKEVIVGDYNLNMFCNDVKNKDDDNDIMKN